MLRDYRYILIRYAPDSMRMEPTNVGVILQGEGRIDMKIDPDTARRQHVDTEEFRNWKIFLTTEVLTESVPLFQPDRSKEEFLRYLETLCSGPVYLSKPLVLQSAEQEFDALLEVLYARLVAAPTPKPLDEVKRPTGAFRRWSHERRFLDRGMRRHAHIITGTQHRLWMAYRQVLNGEAIALDKVEAANRFGETSTEIDRLSTIKERLGEFLSARVDGKRTRYYLLADKLSRPFNGQSEAEFNLMQADLEERVASIAKIGGEVLRSPQEVLGLVNDLDRKLPRK
jgi:hypothetical protein